MLAISKETDYALKLLLFLVRNKGSFKLADITKQESLPYKYLTRLVLVLTRAGLVTSKKGRGGGYILAKRPTQITLKDILVLFERQKGVIACLSEGKKCEVKDCPQRSAWAVLETKLLKEASKIRL